MTATSPAKLHPQQPEGLPWIELRVKHKVPSLNQILAMNPWARRKEKQRTQAAVLFALKALENDSLTRELICTVDQNTLKTHSNILHSYMTTQRSSPKAQSRKKKPGKTKKK
jgi:hypothetical protein